MSEFKDVVVLLPGILGSVLERADGKRVWATSAGAVFRALMSFGNSLESLTLTSLDADDGVRAPALLSDVHLIPGLWKIDGYTRVADMLTSRFGLTKESNFFEFPYDWRRDNRVAARELARLAPRWLHDWRRDSGAADAKLILIGHSMGGLISRYYLDVLGGWRDTRMLITFGTPYRGSLKALDVLTHGFEKGFLNLTGLVRSMPSAYQLLPIYPCVTKGGGAPVRPAEAAIPGLDSGAAQAALAFHREIEAAAAANLGQAGYDYAIHPIVGTNQPTLQGARLGTGGLEMLEVETGGGDLAGDGTVPRVSAMPLEERHHPAAMYASRAHASMQNATDVLAHVEGLLSGTSIMLGKYRGTFGESPVELSLRIEDAYAHGEPVAVAVRPSRVIETELTAYFGQIDTSNVTALALVKDEGDWYRGVLPPPPEGVYRVTIKGETEVVPVSDVFAVFPPPGADVALPSAARTSKVAWSESFELFDVSTPIAEVSRRVTDMNLEFVILRRGADSLYAFSALEIFDAESLRSDADCLDALPVHEDTVTPQAPDAQRPTTAAALDEKEPSRGRVVAMGEDRRPVAVGEPRRLMAAAEALTRGELESAEGDEGTIASRNPSIAALGPATAGEMVKIQVDLLLDRVDEGTDGGAVVMTGLDPTWMELPIEVRVMAPDITFAAGADAGTVTIRRNAASEPLVLEGRIRPDAPAEIEVAALFTYKRRLCGAAQRLLPVASPAAAGAGAAPTPTASPTLASHFALDQGAGRPDLLITIARSATDPLGRFRWWLSPKQCPNLPARLDGTIDLGLDPAAYFKGLVSAAVNAKPGDHLGVLLGIGQQIYDQAPQVFKDAYKAMRAEFGVGFTIQFVTDDPHVPWELMLPEDAQAPGGDAVSFLCVDHPVGRWFLDYQGNMDAHLRPGRLVTIAPNYTESQNLRPLPAAQQESQALEQAPFKALRVAGKKKDVVSLLYDGIAKEQISIVHFAGHGAYSGEQVAPSRICLEDDCNLTVLEVRNPLVQLGKKQRPLVVLNACEVGATNEVLGGIGGWAEAFLRSRFAGLIAPLWPVYDKQAAQLIRETLEGVIVQRRPVGEVLQRARKPLLNTSPTALAYVYFGDVTACLPQLPSPDGL